MWHHEVSSGANRNILFIHNLYVEERKARIGFTRAKGIMDNQPEQQSQSDYQPEQQPRYDHQPLLYGRSMYVPPPHPKKNFWTRKVTLPIWAIVLATVVLIGVVSNVSAKGASSDTTSSQDPIYTTGQQVPASASVPTDTPTPVPHFVTIQTFTGNGTKKTAIFHVGDDWKIVWFCDPSSFMGGSYNVQVDVVNSDGSDMDPAAVNTICQSGNTGDVTEEHQSGDVYLSVNSEAAWKIQIQNLQ